MSSVAFNKIVPFGQNFVFNEFDITSTKQLFITCKLTDYK